MEVVLFIVALVGILIAAEFFTNAVEDIGDKLGLSHGVTGSLLAAVGTALPETLVPIVALIAGSSVAREEIANGAILGAPFMLATLGFTIIGLAALLRREFFIRTDTFLLRRDLLFFMPMFIPAVLLGTFADLRLAKVFYGILLVLAYVFYIYHVIKKGGEKVEHDGELHFNRYLKLPHRLWVSFSQLFVSLIVLLLAVELFVRSLEEISLTLGVSPLVFSLLVAPVATELPEKFNSFFWSLRGKYELAFGNITGAMVFQATFPVSVGLLFTDWQIPTDGIISGTFAIIGALLVYLQLLIFRRIFSPLLVLNGFLYLLYIWLVFGTYRLV